MIEIQRNNVTVAEFFNYIKIQCGKKGMVFGLERDLFENPKEESSSSYIVIDGIKKCRYSEYRTHPERRRKLASYKTPEGFERFYYTDEFETVEETKLFHYSSDWPADDAPCKAEASRSFPYDFQTYFLGFDGTCYNEICEFTFDSEKRGHGYYYQLNKF